MPDFSHDGLSFHYREAGRGRPFLFQHGLGGDHTQTFSLFSPPAGFRLLTLDCRGHGETHPLGPEEKLSIQQFAEDLRALIDHLALGRVIMGGISMGAAVALHFALTYPDRIEGLVLSRPAWLEEVRTTGFEMFAEIARLIRTHGAFDGALRFQQTPEFEQMRRRSPDNALSLLAQFAHPRAAETVAKLERIPRHQPTYRRGDWSRIRVPTLILGNRKDLIHPFEFAGKYAEAIPGAEFHELTPKSTDPQRHAADNQRILADFLVKHFGERA